MTLLRRPDLRARSVAVLGVGVLLAGITYVGWSTATESEASSGARPALTSGGATVDGELVPGGAVTGSLVVRNATARAVRVSSAGFEPAVAAPSGCTGGVVFALTVAPTPATPLVVPPAGTVTALGWTAFMPADSADACQGARFTGALVLGGERVGSAEVVAGRLAGPGQPMGGETTPTRAGVQWDPAPAATAYLVERARAGTSEWLPACGTGTTALLTPFCTDTGLEPGTAYAYRAVSVRGAWRAVGRLSTDIRTQPPGRRPGSPAPAADAQAGCGSSSTVMTRSTRTAASSRRSWVTSRSVPL